MILRPYQQEAVDSIFNCWNESVGRHLLISAPTGSGKSIILAEIVKRLCTEWPSIKILIITDTKELITQDEKSIKDHFPKCNIGIFSSGLKKHNTKAQVILCSIQSMYSKAYSFDHVDIIIIDEAHLVSPKSATRFQVLFKQMDIGSPGYAVVGLTATPFRMTEGNLCEGEGALFDHIAYVCDMKQLIKDGYLTKVISKGGLAKINLDGVKIRNGDFDPRELACAADSPELVRRAVEEIVELGADRKAWLIFTSSIAHSMHVKEELMKHHIDCEVVTGDTESDERDSIVNKFKSGKLRCLINVSIYTKGLDVPRIDMICLLTSTKSKGRYIQEVGRGMRVFPGKEDCLLLDFGRSCMDHGPIDSIDPVKTKNIFNCEKAPIPQKECPKCRAIIHARMLTCPSCGYEYPIPDAEARHGVNAFEGAVMSDQVKPFLVEVKEMYCTRHHKPGKTDSLKMCFYDNLDREFPTWICLNHKGFAQEKALAIVKQMGGTAKTVDEALKEWHTWRKPAQIQCKPDGKWTRVTGYAFPKGQSQQQKLEEE